MAFNTVVVVLVGLLARHVSFVGAKGDAADQKFAKCCKEKSLPCPDDCWYKGLHISIPLDEFDGECYGSKYYENWVHCATGPTDNRDCCKKANVTDPICLELCDGTHPLSVKEPWRFYGCFKFNREITRCNHDVNNK